jgi:hypothetical protein
MSEQPATSTGTTSAAGEDVSDEQLAAQVAEQTDSNLEVEQTFERESDGVTTDTEAAKASGDELAE